jgi:rubrerythrin
MPNTTENLNTAFAGESQAYQKYSAFADKAQKDGFENIAKLFRTTAEAERIHAEGHLKALDGIGSTLENLEKAIGGETYEFDDMYPPMYEQAVAEKHKAKKMFGYALEAEKVHAELYTKALEAVKEGKDLDEVNIYLCPICGHIELGEPTENCPICGVKPSTYVQIEK